MAMAIAFRRRHRGRSRPRKICRRCSVLRPLHREQARHPGEAAAEGLRQPRYRIRGLSAGLREKSRWRSSTRNWRSIRSRPTTHRSATSSRSGSKRSRNHSPPTWRAEVIFPGADGVHAEICVDSGAAPTQSNRCRIISIGALTISRRRSNSGPNSASRTRRYSATRAREEDHASEKKIESDALSAISGQLP